MQTDPRMKICPQCKVASNIAATRCTACGHQFRTQFAPPVGQTVQVAPVNSNKLVASIPTWAKMVGLVVLGALVLFAMKRALTQPIVGAWQGDTDRIEFYSDGTGVSWESGYYGIDRRPVRQRWDFKWSVKDNALNIETSSQPPANMHYTVSRDGSVLTLAGVMPSGFVYNYVQHVRVN